MSHQAWGVAKIISVHVGASLICNKQPTIEGNLDNESLHCAPTPHNRDVTFGEMICRLPLREE